MHTQAQSFYENIERALKDDKLVLPSLPEVALEVRQKVEQNDCTAPEIADLLAQDGALSANFIRVANSPLYRGIEPMQDLKTIISRMGLTMVKNLVVSLALKQIFIANSDSLDKQLRAAWSTSVGVAAISRMLATMIKGLSPEQALLAGLVHNIGVLPILTIAEQEQHSFSSEAELESIIRLLQGRLGELVLSHWGFSEHLIDVVNGCYDFQRQHEGNADYTDVVQIALLQGGYLNGAAPEDYSHVPAFEKLNLDPEVNVVEIEENQAVIEETKQSLNG